MHRLSSFFLILIFLGAFIPDVTLAKQLSPRLLVGAERFEMYFNKLTNKKVGMVVNHTSLVGTPYKETHLVDSLLTLGINITNIFSPEHGFRGNADAGEKVKGGIDSQTELPIISLYGDHKKPFPEDLDDVDILVFDIQDVGARFYTYISTMHYVMEAAAEKGIPVIVLDRPNPNGFYIDGPILQSEFKSFVGMHEVPIVHGMTVGEYAQMINGEGWLANGVTCDLSVIECEYYSHNTLYKLRQKPSPNLPNMTAIYLYPSLCLFEGTVISVGRGTDKPFQVYGHPDFALKNFSFKPKPTEGAKNPKLKGKTCYGFDLSALRKDFFVQHKGLNLSYLMEFYQKFPDKSAFFTPFFDKLAGTDKLRKQIEEGFGEREIRKSWEEGLEKFQSIRKKYLLYPDFN